MPVVLRMVPYILFYSSLFFRSPIEAFGDDIEAEFQDKVPACKVSYEASKERLLNELDRLENLYMHYRFVENKIRLITYDDLWEVRQQSLEPLSKQMRTEGNEEEERLLEVLKTLDRESNEASNGIWDGLKKFSQHENSFTKSCAQKNYEECMMESLKPVFDAVEAGLPIFDHIFENERAYRKEVELTVGSRKGLYPEDALEGPSQHTDYFPRYELERRSMRFEEDRQMIKFFQKIRKMLTDHYAGDRCCDLCGPPSLLTSLNGKDVSEK